MGEPTSQGEAHFEHPLSLTQMFMERITSVHRHSKRQTWLVMLSLILSKPTNVPEMFKNCVNLSQKSTADHLLSIRHADKVGTESTCTRKFEKNGHNIQEMEKNIIFSGSKVLLCKNSIVGRPDDSVIQDLRSNVDIFSVDIKQIL